MGVPGTSHLAEAGTEFLCCLHFSDAFAPATFCCLDHQGIADLHGHLRESKAGVTVVFWSPAHHPGSPHNSRHP